MKRHPALVSYDKRLRAAFRTIDELFNEAVDFTDPLESFGPGLEEEGNRYMRGLEPVRALLSRLIATPEQRAAEISHALAELEKRSGLLHDALLGGLLAIAQADRLAHGADAYLAHEEGVDEVAQQ